MQASQGAVGGAVQGTLTENIPFGLLPSDLDAVAGNIPLGSLPIEMNAVEGAGLDQSEKQVAEERDILVAVEYHPIGGSVLLEIERSSEEE